MLNLIVRPPLVETVNSRKLSLTIKPFLLQLAKDIGIIDDDDDEKDIQSPSDDESNHSD